MNKYEKRYSLLLGFLCWLQYGHTRQLKLLSILFEQVMDMDLAFSIYPINFYYLILEYHNLEFIHSIIYLLIHNLQFHYSAGVGFGVRSSTVIRIMRPFSNKQKTEIILGAKIIYNFFLHLVEEFRSEVLQFSHKVFNI